MTSYPVLSLSPPYGTLIELLLKRIETRGWQTSHRGPLLIHQTAAPGPKGTTEAAFWDRCLSEPFRSALPKASPARLPRGKIIALVDLIGCYQTPIADGTFCTLPTGQELPPDEPEWSFGDYTPGRYAWLLDNVRPLPTPIIARGLPGLWRWEGELGL